MIFLHSTAELACSESWNTKLKNGEVVPHADTFQLHGNRQDQVETPHIVRLDFLSKLSHSGMKAQQFKEPSWTIYFRHIWRSSPPCRGPAVQQEHCSAGFRRFSPELSSCSLSPLSDLPFSSRPHNLGKHKGQKSKKSRMELNNWSLYIPDKHTHKKTTCGTDTKQQQTTRQTVWRTKLTLPVNVRNTFITLTQTWVRYGLIRRRQTG